MAPSKDSYRSSRGLYIAEAAFEYFVSILVTGAYLAKLTSYLGFSDSLTAVLTSFVALGCSFQLFAVFFFKGGSVKRRVTLFHLINQLLFMSAYECLRTTSVIGNFFRAYGAGYSVSPKGYFKTQTA